MKRSCNDCIHDKLCDKVAIDVGIPFVNPDTCEDYMNKADVAEVKHGYWYDVDGDVGWELVSCSVCREKYSFCDGEDRTDYCPNCGAKMDGKKK